MSKLIEKLQDTYEGPTQSLGFRTVSASSYQAMVLLALVGHKDIDKQKDLAELQMDAIVGGVDALKEEVLQSFERAAGELPWGVWVQECTQDHLQQVVEAGADFLIFDPEKMPAAVTQIEEVGKIIKVDLNSRDKLLSTIDQIPVDAVLIELEENRPPCITVRDLMRCKRVADLTNSPLLIVIGNTDLSEGDLRALWDAGVGGIVVRGSGEALNGRIIKLHGMVEELPSKRKGQVEGGQVSLTKSGKNIPA